MVRNSNDLMKNMIVSFFMLVGLFTQSAYLSTGDGYFTVFLSGGIAAGIYLALGRKVLPAILITSIVGTIVIEMLYNDLSFNNASLLMIPITFVNIFLPILLGSLLRLLNVTIPNTVRDGGFYIAAMVITVTITAIFPALQYTTASGAPFFVELKRFVQPIFVGVGVFTTGVIMSNHYDSTLTKKNLTNYWDLAFAVVFSLSTYYIFTGSMYGLNFTSFAPIFILLFIVNAFMFNYRMLLFISWMYITTWNIVYFYILELPFSSISIEAFNIYLLVLILITIFLKVLIYEITSKNEELTETKERYEDMLNSTFELLKVRETIDYDDIKYLETNMKNIFNIAMRIFNNVEYGSCLLRGPKYIKVLDTKGHNTELLKNIKIGRQNLNWERFEPVLRKDLTDLSKRALGDRYEVFKNVIPNYKESISILIKLNEEERGAITFDILHPSSSKFTSGDLYNIGAFQSMINSFYEMNELAIKNNSLRDDIVLSLIRTLELYDQYTGGHSEDVAFIANQLSKKMNLSNNERYDIYWAGIVHDIGKIGVSSDIINKPSKLTLSEYKKIQEHPVFGYEILAKSEDLKVIAKLVKHHHEWYNGSGYPDELKGDEIPLGSQILQVADSVSSMATKRSYQTQKSCKEIIDELIMYRGIQFNPEITDFMIELIKEGVITKYFKTRLK